MTQRTQETQPEPQSQSQDGIDRRLLPWSHRLPVWARFLVDLLAGAVVGGTGGYPPCVCTETAVRFSFFKNPKC